MRRGFLRPVAAPAVATTALLAAGTLVVTPASATTDTTPPVFTAMTSGMQTGEWIEYMGWWAEDSGSGVRWVNARYRVREPDGTWTRWRYPDRWQHRKAKDHIHKYIRRHRSYVFEVRAVDRAGNKTTWEMCGGAGRT